MHSEVFFIVVPVIFNFSYADNNHLADFPTSSTKRVQPCFGLNTMVYCSRTLSCLVTVASDTVDPSSGTVASTPCPFRARNRIPDAPKQTRVWMVYLNTIWHTCSPNELDLGSTMPESGPLVSKHP